VERLLAGASRLPGFFDTHPPTGERSAATATQAQHLGWQREPGVARDRADYLRRLAGLVVGENPAEGVYQDGRFLHPDLGFALRIPDGWRFVNTPAAVGALAPDGRGQVVLELAGPGDDPGVFADEFLVGRAPAARAEIEGRRSYSLGGFPAVELRGSAPAPEGRIHARITFVAHEGRVYQLGNLALGLAADRVLPRGDVFIRSFRSLSPEDRAAIEVRRLRLATAREGESLADFSQRTGNDWDAQRTAIANGMFASDRLAQGQLLKIAVVEPYVFEPDGTDGPDARR
jgi:predicted Zn-dependent protease